MTRDDNLTHGTQNFVLPLRSTSRDSTDRPRSTSLRQGNGPVRPLPVFCARPQIGVGPRTSGGLPEPSAPSGPKPSCFRRYSRRFFIARLLARLDKGLETTGFNAGHG